MSDCGHCSDHCGGSHEYGGGGDWSPSSSGSSGGSWWDRPAPPARPLKLPIFLLFLFLYFLAIIISTALWGSTGLQVGVVAGWIPAAIVLGCAERILGTEALVHEAH